MRLEETLIALRDEQRQTLAQIDQQAIDRERMESVIEFAQAVGEGLEEAEDDFAARRRFVELLDVTGALTIEDGKRVLDLSCAVDDTQRIVYSSISTSVHNQQEPIVLTARLVLDSAS